MGGSVQIGRVLGIPLRVHFTFLLLLAFLGGAAYLSGGLEVALWSVLSICALVVCVILHELAHSVVARRFGVEVESITLLPIGGVASMKEMPREPREEGLMAIAGPIASLAIAGVFYGIIKLTGYHGPEGYAGQRILDMMVWMNIIIAVFNLIPAFPMDGGRVLRAVLAHYMGLVKATKLAVTLGQVLAVLLGLFGLLFNVWMVLIAVFIYFGAGQEGRQVQMQAVLESVTARQAMMVRYDTLARQQTLAEALAFAGQGYQHDFPVLDDQTIIGIATRQDLVNAYYSLGPNRLVGEVTNTEVCQVAPEASMAEVYRVVAQGTCRVVLVREGDFIIGIVTPESFRDQLAAASSGYPMPPSHRV